jgi:hypothetical protein
MNEVTLPKRDDVKRRSMRRLGLILGLITLVITATFFVIFTVYGLPRDPTEYRRLQQRQLELEQMHAPEGASTSAAAPTLAQPIEPPSGTSAATRTKQ